MENQKIRVLCLHGCNQNTEIFSGYMKNMMRICKKTIEFFFLEAEYDHPIGGKTWYHKPLNVPDIGSIEYSNELVGDTLEKVQQEIVKNNIDVLLGFSQGGNVVDAYLAYELPKHKENRPKKAVILSGYELVDKERKKDDQEVPVMSIFSDEDDVVLSKHRPVKHKNLNELKHDMGHKIPRSDDVRRIKEFIESLE